jgi:hypothetical protein
MIRHHEYNNTIANGQGWFAAVEVAESPARRAQRRFSKAHRRCPAPDMVVSNPEALDGSTNHTERRYMFQDYYKKCKEQMSKAVVYEEQHTELQELKRNKVKRNQHRKVDIIVVNPSNEYFSDVTNDEAIIGHEEEEDDESFFQLAVKDPAEEFVSALYSGVSDGNESDSGDEDSILVCAVETLLNCDEEQDTRTSYDNRDDFNEIPDVLNVDCECSDLENEKGLVQLLKTEARPRVRSYPGPRTARRYEDIDWGAVDWSKPHFHNEREV